ncbi:hypothetical protein X797_005986 [Metarhizium robertsii]|uniref:Uncharacterized protein n=1 Tax=Metarhizium robertsii TaxID=568076 RepID=A0A0A1UUC0_9HYPO|nr:hypothetical protein X797_005986 [Metarhizium robertsii]
MRGVFSPELRAPRPTGCHVCDGAGNGNYTCMTRRHVVPQVYCRLRFRLRLRLRMNDLDLYCWHLVEISVVLDVPQRPWLCTGCLTYPAESLQLAVVTRRTN